MSTRAVVPPYSGVSDLSSEDARDQPELGFHTPKASRRERCPLSVFMSPFCSLQSKWHAATNDHAAGAGSHLHIARRDAGPNAD